MDANGKAKVFIKNGDISWEQLDKGVSRKIIAYDDKLMPVKVEFETAGIDSIHKHYHSRISHVESGEFEMEINGGKSTQSM